MKSEWPWRCFSLLACCLVLQAQAGPATQTSSQSGRSIGVVVAIDATVKRITLKTDAGPEIGIEFQDTFSGSFPAPKTSAERHGSRPRMCRRGTESSSVAAAVAKPIPL